MERGQVKQELEAIAVSLENPHVSGRTTPRNVQTAVEYASRYRLVVAAVDRHGNELSPSDHEWRTMTHSFYHLKLNRADYPVIGTFSIPQSDIHNSASINQVVHELLDQYPCTDVVAARHEKTFSTPTMSGEPSYWRLHDVRLVYVNGGLNGYSLKNGGERVCSGEHCGMCE